MTQDPVTGPVGSRGLLRMGAPAFVDRRAELEYLGDQLDRAFEGEAGVVLVEGDAGVGKTRLVREVIRAAEDRGMQTCFGRCVEGSSMPYLPFATLVPQLERAGLLRRDALEREDFSVLRQLTTMAPKSSEPSGRLEDSVPQLLRALPLATIALSTRRPLVFIVDDLHWAEGSTFDAFVHLVLTVCDAASRGAIRLLIIATHRPADSGSMLDRSLKRTRREEIVSSLRLGGLDEFEVNEIVRDTTQTRCSRQLLAALMDTSGGNPLFVQELLLDLDAKDRLEKREGYLFSSVELGDLALPIEVTAAITDRVARLDRESKELLILASLLGDEIPLASLESLASAGPRSVLDLLEPSIQAGFVAEAGPMIQFVHPIFRHVFSRLATAARRRRLHLRIAESLLASQGADEDDRAIEIADHLIAAGRGADESLTRKYAKVGGDQAFALAAWAQAARFYEAALAASGDGRQLPDGEAGRLLQRSGTAHYRNLEIVLSRQRFAEAIDRFKAAGDFMGWAEALEGWIRAHISHGAVPFGVLFDTGLVEEFFEAVGDRDPRARARVLNEWADVLFVAARPDAQQAAEEVLEVGQASDDRFLCVHASVTLGLAHYRALNSEDALTWYDKAAEYARGMGDPWLEGWPIERKPLALVALGRLDEADKVATEAAALTMWTRDWAERSMILACRAAIAVARGDFDAAERLAADALSMYNRSDYVGTPAILFPSLAQNRFMGGASEEAKDVLAIWTQTGASGAAWLLGQVGEAWAENQTRLRAEIRSHPQRALRRDSPDAFNLGSIASQAELAIALADAEMAAHPHTALSLAVQKGVLFSLSQGVYLLPRVLGETASLAGDWEEAESYFKTALATAQACGARPEGARTMLGRAEMLLRRGLARDRDDAAALLQEALAVFADLRMRPFVERARRVARAARMNIVEPKPAATYQDGFDDLDIDILLKVADGNSTTEIADGMLLSERTVSRRVEKLRNVIGVIDAPSARDYLTGNGLVAPAGAAVLARPAGPPSRREAETQSRSLRVVLVADLVRSTEINQVIGDDEWVRLLGEHNEIVRRHLATFRGHEIKHTGDGILATFASASDALQCALSITEEFPLRHSALPDLPLEMRVGVSAGEPLVMGADIFGLAVTQAFRICTRARAGQVLVADTVRQLYGGTDLKFEDRGRFSLKGFRDRTRVFEVNRRG